MTSDNQMYEHRCHIFNYFFSHSLSVMDLCKLFHRSRTWFYKWKQRYDMYGEAGLRTIDRSPPAMPNKTPLDIEMKILDFIITYPAYGPVRIAHELADVENDTTVSHIPTLQRHIILGVQGNQVMPSAVKGQPKADLSCP